ncbi:MAG: biotin transporter BioY [Candidatus Delongbacteria bacterium]|jgi:biotin transporter BioY|nr:biotin transporter BioY [Candidatus Delongbacteria bacterium]
MNTNLANLTLADTIWKEKSIAKDIILVASTSLMIALMAQIVIPMYPVPFTGQTLGVLLTGALIGKKRASLSLLSYLLMGFIGMPVFVGGTFGIARLAGPTGGYLIGFVFAAMIVGYLCEKGWDRNFITSVFAMIIGSVVIYSFGLLWLSNFTGWSKVLSSGLIPFISGDIIKILIAASILPAGWKLIKK